MTETAETLRARRCVPCEGGVPPLTPDQVAGLLKALPDWTVSDDGLKLRRKWKARNFQAGIDFFSKLAHLAETEGHHPDLHLEGYRNVIVELTTHAIGGLSENDFIVAAKIDQLPIEAKK